MKIRPRKFFDQEPVREALDEYLSAWEALLDDTRGEQMLIHHASALEAEIKAVKARHTGLAKELKDADPATAKVIRTAANHASRDISTLVRASQELDSMNWVILEDLRKEACDVLKEFRQGDKMIFDANGNLNSKYIKKFYAKSPIEIWERYAEADAIYEKGNEFAIEERDPEERAYQLARIPREIRRAKWKFMLALADAAYSINIGQLGGGDESIDPNHLLILSRLYARLSDHERGADNDHMPFTHKYRHNPAIHSLHTLALADKMFHNVMWTLDHHPERFNGKQEKLVAKLKQMRSRIFLTALVHDMGEIDGELSQGIQVAHMDKATREKIEEARNAREHETFVRHLDRSVDQLRHVEKGQLTAEPITIREWLGIRRSYLDAFELSEKTDVFLGRFFKTLERMQSNHDYLRFQGLADAKLLKDSDEPNKVFSVNYAPRIFYDANWDVVVPGPQALSKLAQKGRDTIETTLQRMLTEETEKELTHLTQRNIEYYGADSQEMKKYARIMEKRSAALAR